MNKVEEHQDIDQEDIPKILAQKTFGQSFVELALLLPVLLIILSGLLEFGIALNEYIEIQDSVRESARFASDNDPFLPGTTTDRPDFYIDAINIVTNTLTLPLDPAQDDIVISVFSVEQGVGITRYPSGGQWNLPGGPTLTSSFSTAEVLSRINTSAPSSGIVLVELFYSYDQKLALPWITPFVPDPLIMHTYTIMPLRAATP